MRAGIPTNFSLLLIFLILLLDIIGISILYPVAPYIVRGYGGDALMLTLLTAIYAAAQFFGAPLLGKLGDRYGRRPVLLLSLLGSALGYLIFGVGGALWILFFSRFLDGITGGNQSTASAYIADVSPPKDRAKNLALISVAWGVGLVVGPALGALLGQFNLNAPAFFAAGLALVELLLAIFWLPESLPREQRETRPMRWSDFNPFGSIRAMTLKPGLAVLLLTFCLFQFAFNGINSIASLFVIEKFNAQPWQVGFLLVLAGGALIVAQQMTKAAVRRFGERIIGIVALLGQALGALAIFVAPALWVIFLLNLFTGPMSSFSFSTLSTLTANRVAPRELGVLMGVTTALGSLMNIFGVLWAGAVYDHVMPGAPYWMGAVIFMLAALVLSRATPQTS